jgi:hypothetical protein
MPNYSSTMTKCEDAAAYWLADMVTSNLSGVTVYKGGAGDDIALPCIIIASDRIAPSAPLTTHLTSRSKTVELSVKVITHGDASSRATHDLICGDVEAVFIQSQNQAVAVMTAAAIADFAPLAWYFTDASPEYSDNRRETIYRFQMEVST